MATGLFSFDCDKTGPFGLCAAASGSYQINMVSNVVDPRSGLTKWRSASPSALTVRAFAVSGNSRSPSPSRRANKASDVLARSSRAPERARPCIANAAGDYRRCDAAGAQRPSGPDRFVHPPPCVPPRGGIDRDKPGYSGTFRPGVFRRLLVSPVRWSPGSINTTCTPNRLTSRRNDSLNPSRANFEAL